MHNQTAPTSTEAARKLAKQLLAHLSAKRAIPPEVTSTDDGGVLLHWEFNLDFDAVVHKSGDAITYKNNLTNGSHAQGCKCTINVNRSALNAEYAIIALDNNVPGALLEIALPGLTATIAQEMDAAEAKKAERKRQIEANRAARAEKGKFK